MATRIVTVLDTTPPVLTVTGANPWNLNAGTTFVDPGATATDACAGDLTANIVRTGAVNALRRLSHHAWFPEKNEPRYLGCYGQKRFRHAASQPLSASMVVHLRFNCRFGSNCEIRPKSLGASAPLRMLRHGESGRRRARDEEKDRGESALALDGHQTEQADLERVRTTFQTAGPRS